MLTDEAAQDRPDGISPTALDALAAASAAQPEDYLNPSRLKFSKFHHASNGPSLTKRQLERVAKTTTAFRESNTKRWTLPLRTHRERLRYELC